MSSMMPVVPQEEEEQSFADGQDDSMMAAALSASETDAEPSFAAPLVAAAGAAVAESASAVAAHVFKDDAQIPGSYHGPLISSITVFLAFSLAFARYWTFEAAGNWTPPTIASDIVVVAGIALQVLALYRALDLRDDLVGHYRVTVRYFFIGVLITIVGITASALLYQ